MIDDNTSQKGIGSTCPPPRGLLEQIDMQINIHQDLLRKLQILRAKLAFDPELEDIIVNVRRLL